MKRWARVGFKSEVTFFERNNGLSVFGIKLVQNNDS